VFSDFRTSASSHALSGAGRFAAVALVAGIALVGSTLVAGPASAATPIPLHHHGAISLNGGKVYPAGTYIVQLRDAPAATYTGGVSGYAATSPREGAQLNARSSTVKNYTKHLTATTESVVAAHGVHAPRS
jgi:hypothetical protein